MRSQIIFAILLVLVSLLQGACLGNGPNPYKTFGDHVAGVVDGVTGVILWIPMTILFVVWLFEQSVTAAIRSDGGSGNVVEPTETPCPDEEHVEFPPPTGDEPSDCWAGKSCG
ncbi:MAG: hypothetical protein QNJ90_13565 [Planctomycetota bacterium]|nr:hypothetical protein [Planctomycetota bacterium]